MADCDHRLFLECFLREEPLLRAFLLSATGSMDAVDDLLQATAEVLLGKWGQFDRSRPFRQWAMGIARLEVLKRRQRMARSKEVLSEEALLALSETGAQDDGEIDRRQRFLWECVERLDGRHREVLAMKYGLGLKIAEIAGRVGKSVAAVEMTLVRLRRILRECIDRKVMGAAGGT